MWRVFAIVFVLFVFIVATLNALLQTRRAHHAEAQLAHALELVGKATATATQANNVAGECVAFAGELGRQRDEARAQTMKWAALAPPGARID